MRLISVKTIAYLTLISLATMGAAHAKPIKKKFGNTQNGKTSQSTLDKLSKNVESAQRDISQERYEDIVANPDLAKTDDEKLAALSAREYIILVDQSGSMNAEDENPTGAMTHNSWTRWDSARVAAESIAELTLALDKNADVDIMLWEGYGNKLRAEYLHMKRVSDISKFFNSNQPQRGSTPLAGALEKIYTDKLQGFLSKIPPEPFTVIILTDGQPNNSNKVKKFFKKIIKDNKLEKPGRETLAAFSFVQVGDDEGAEAFLTYLDDNLIDDLGVGVDIVDTKKDNFLFGTGKYKNQSEVGPFSLFYDALFD